jgi:hypothetical protein
MRHADRRTRTASLLSVHVMDSVQREHKLERIWRKQFYIPFLNWQVWLLLTTLPVPGGVLARRGDGHSGGRLVALAMCFPQETQVLLTRTKRQRRHPVRRVAASRLGAQLHPRLWNELRVLYFGTLKDWKNILQLITDTHLPNACFAMDLMLCIADSNLLLQSKVCFVCPWRPSAI